MGDDGAVGADGNNTGMGGSGNGDASGNSIGSGVGKVDGKKREAKKAGRYIDAKNAPAQNRYLNRKTEQSGVRNDDFSRIYAPDGKMPNTRATGKRGEKGKETVSYFRGAPDKAEANTPYYEVFSRYAPAAENAMHREDIPATYKQQVKSYFDALRSGSKGP